MALIAEQIRVLKTAGTHLEVDTAGAKIDSTVQIQPLIQNLHCPTSCNNTSSTILLRIVIGDPPSAANNLIQSNLNMWPENRLSAKVIR